MREEDKKIKELLQGKFDEVNPSIDFTQSIMDKIGAQEVLNEKKEFEYEPVISKSSWVIILGVFLTFVILGLTSSSNSNLNLSDYIPNWQFDFASFNPQFLILAMLSLVFLLAIDHFVVRLKNE